ncbi:HEAT repeat domain-containing protein [Methanobacterium alcaliphilum]|uniref:HEAT repeat domain-containing protein n=1 Tax=Methanobacterium alcaliphilum TaxID=392018 RepID=UPI00200A2C24|nr:HEAT repeat domain-containing protein [Methanobacterium alcaliphilum]MCK9152172.1 HEAT repeat domain-containing protein [Methanobacterium alcaliphilum]
MFRGDHIIYNEYRPDVDELAAKKDVEGLIKALENEDFIIRKESAHALKNVGDLRAVDALIKSLEYDDWQAKYSVLSSVRANSAEALGKIGSKKGTLPLIEALEDPDSEVRWKAAEALGNIGDRTAVDSLILALSDKDSDVRKHAARSLGDLEDNKALYPLIDALNDVDWPVRKNAVTALGKIGDEDSLKFILKALDDNDIDVRRHAIGALVKMKKTAVKPLLDKLNSFDWQTRAIAAEALGRIGDRKAVMPLSEVLSGHKKRDENRYVRGKAAEALGRIGDKKAIKYLESALDEKYIFVRKRAQEALNLIELTPELDHFENEEFCFDFPLFWDVENIYKYEKLIIGYWPSKSFKFSINRKKNVDDITAEDFADVIADVFEDQDADKISKSEVSIANSNGFRVIGDNLTLSQRTLVFVFKKYGDLFYFWFSGNPKDMNESYKYIEILINSFHLR